MGDPCQLGVPGLTLGPGDHVCALYMGTQGRDEVLLPYLRAGLRAGDKCICVVDSTSPEHVRSSISDGIDVDGCIASEQFHLCGAGDAYLRTGRFSTDDILDFWNDAVGAAVSSGRFPFARVAGEMPAALRDLPERDEFFRYESELNRFVARYPQAVLCLYDLNHCGGGVLLDLFRTHPKVLLSGLVMENPYYLSPDTFLSLEGKARARLAAPRDAGPTVPSSP
jgi:MEDS: MEthanogen/methylotroph, DcmR Sensory domain